MTETIKLGGMSIRVTRKAVKNVHLSVHPPDGAVSLVAPTDTRLDVARAYAISKLDWIRKQQARLHAQARETPRQFVERETHYLWGRRYLLRVIEHDAAPEVSRGHETITLKVRPDSGVEKRAEILHTWHKRLLHKAVPPLIAQWEGKLGVTVTRYYLQRMKTKWGSCTPRSGHIRLNTELVKKPPGLLEYVVVHEMAHLIEPTHNDRFINILDTHYPNWRDARLELNRLPLTAESWVSIAARPD